MKKKYLNRRAFLKGFMAAAGTVGAGGLPGCRLFGSRAPSLGELGSRNPPNLVLLLTDDQRWDALGCMGNPVIHTPEIDALAKEGVVFDNMFVTTSICAASRASIFTGRYARSHGIHGFAADLSPEQMEETYPQVLRRAGYHVGFVGKYGVGREMPAGTFDDWRGFPGQGRYFEPDDPGGKHLTERLGDGAVAFIDQAPRQKPFCLSVSFKAAHSMDYDPDPYPFDPRFSKLYEGMEMPVPPLAAETAYGNLPEFLKETEGRKRWKNRFITPERFQESLRNYFRLLSGVDHAVGRIKEKLEQEGLASNTVILFTSDNGYFLGDRGLAGKWYMYEESIRVPLVIHDPRLPASHRGRRVSAMALNIDLAPTLLELAGLPAPGAMQGASLVPFMEGRSPAWRKDFFYEHLFSHPLIPKSEGVRTARWKYIRWIEREPPFEELFDLENDPGELRNLASDPAHRAVLERLRARWAEYRESLVAIP